LAEEFRKEFLAGPADRTPQEASQWRIGEPDVGTNGPLTIQFGKSMDYALLQHMIVVMGPSGRVEGSVSVAQHETEWRFTPRSAWQRGEYRIVVETALEDLAGNHIGRPFDVDVFDPITRTISRETISIPLWIGRQ
jgi:hypothetical protein